jgi:DNA-binding NarL/FixJ family response regulator
MPISIILADDHAILRRGLKALFESEPGFLIVGVASDGREALRLAEQRKPDVLVIDLMMEGLGGLNALCILRDRAPQIRTVVFSLCYNDTFVAAALKNGAAGYVVKGGPEENLVRAVKEAHAGKFRSPATEMDLRLYRERSKRRPFNAHEMLTRRQSQVLQLAAEGKTSVEAGAVLRISRRTVENHRAMLMERLGLRNQTDLVRHAIRYGLISPDDSGS